MQPQLPKIHDRSLQYGDNPFYVPDEYEIYKLKEKSKQARSEERIKFSKLKIQDKSKKQKGFFTVRTIDRLESEETSFDQEEQEKKNIVENANNALKNRIRQREPMYQFLEKKKEMLLFSMLIDQKRGMIDEYEKLTRLHRKGLEQSEQLIDEDIEMFNKFLETNNNSSRDAIKEAENETRLKQEKTNEIKLLQEHRTELMTKNQQKVDNLEDLIKYKKFLDRITPKEQQKNKRKEKIKIKNKNNPQDNLISSDLQKILDDSDDEFDSYFKDPQQLFDIFQQLEERNLFLIANTKEREQMVEELRSKVDLKKKELEDKKQNAIQNKFDLERQIISVNDQIKTLKSIKNDNEGFESLRNLEMMISRMYKSDLNPEPRKDMSGLEMLRETERKLEQYILEIKRYRQIAPDLVLDKEKGCIRMKKDKMKQEKQEQDLIEMQKKQQEQQKEIIIQKRFGRPIMIRSWPPKEEKEEQVVTEISEEEKERLKMICPQYLLDSINNCNERVIKRAYERLEGKQNLVDVCQQLKQFLRTQLSLQNTQEKKTDNISSLALLLLALCSYKLNDFNLSHLISYFGCSQVTPLQDSIEFDQVEWRKLELEWISIQSLQKMNQLQECILKIETLQKYIKNSKNQKIWAQLENILEQKKSYLKDYVENKQGIFLMYNDEEKAVLAKKLQQLLLKQQNDRYFEQEGYPAYLISSQWIARFSLYTKYYELTKENPDLLKSFLAKKNNSMEDETFVEIFKQYCNNQTYEELERISNSTQNTTDIHICPIYNDDLIDLYTQFEKDPLKAKNYSNYGLNKSIRENQNFIFVSSQIWRFLYNLFGGVEIKRIILCRSKHAVETHLFQVKCQLFPQTQQKIINLQFNGNERMEDLINKVNRITNNKIRNIWKVPKEINQEELMKSQSVIGTKLSKDNILEQSEIGPDEVLLLELEQDQYRLEKKENLQTISIPNKCMSCGNQESQLYLCECRSVKYCNETCQANDLKFHIDACKKIMEKDSLINQLAKKYKVRPPAKIIKNSAKGICGLSNLGNTCFMNSSLQCLSNVTELTEYMIYNTYLQDLNEKNPLGTGGKLACNYAELLKDLYESTSTSVAPWNVKKVIGQQAPQFNGYSQQDSQELLSYLLDGLHEDLNRIKKKPYIPDIEYKGQSDQEFADIYWENHKKRNDSIITDLFTGQFKSRVECPECNFVSITFDPFVTISLPIPNKEYIQFQFYLIFRDSNQTPLKIQQTLQSTQTAGEIIDMISKIKNIKPEYLKFYSLQDSAIIDNGISPEQTIKQIKENQATIFLFEEYDEKIDKPVSKYDSKIKSPYHQVLCNVRKLEESRLNQQNYRISFTRVFYVDSQTTYQDLHLMIYQIFRTNLMQICEITSNLNINKEFEQFLKNIKKFIYKDQFEEYQDLLKLKDSIYQLLDDNNRPLPFTDKQIEVSGKSINLNAQFKLRAELLKLNRCVDAEFTLQTSNQSLQQTITLNDCLNQFCQEEVLGVGNEWYCSKCKKHQKAKKQMQIYKAPQIMILHLKRFRSTRVTQFYGTYSVGGVTKIVQYVDFPLENFNIQPFILEKESQQPYVYDLFAVSNHYGGMGGGHYTAYAKNPMYNAWFDFNDSQVKELRSNPVTDAAYVLFYRRRKVK
ncbi:unnamed protein product [Paramecium pentaurelia]|uniref:ubiquitinyl hydrolase 1 n=1 Tax=Paramecium pentaurelia TaxID=43138 RepID=A0A8S1T5I0_9CILI|nr:unnamed protein product [Paramecium pentaurelia]